MKSILCASLLLVLPFSTAYSQENNTSKKLNTQKSAALGAHLTTRIQWEKFPQPKYKNEDLKEKNRAAILRVYADESGNVTKATVQESTGLKNLDDLLIQAVRVSKVKPYIEEDNAVATIGFQTFNLRFIEEDEVQCSYDFNSKNWAAQKSGEKTSFQYRAQPQISLNTDNLNGHNRSVTFSFKVDKHGDVKKVKIKKGSGVYDLDQKVIQSISNAHVDVPRKFWIYKKSHLKDEIQFKYDGCA